MTTVAEKLKRLKAEKDAQFRRDKTALKYFMLGKGYTVGIAALGFAERHHLGYRKDGSTPSFHHQVQIALSILSLRDVADEQLCLVGAILHDVREDAQVPHEEILGAFGEKAAHLIELLTKKFGNLKKDFDEYIEDLSMDREGALVKGEDRCNNLASMFGVFELEKIKTYTDEAEYVFLPMLKKASKYFPEQSHAFMAVSQKMKGLIKQARTYITVEGERQTEAGKASLNHSLRAQAQAARQEYQKLNTEFKKFDQDLVNAQLKLGEIRKLVDPEQNLKHEPDVAVVVKSLLANPNSVRDAQAKIFSAVRKMLKNTAGQRPEIIEVMMQIAASHAGVSLLDMGDLDTEDVLESAGTRMQGPK
jgi:(p)ppGpp synthase/HD superfamily hydrolase